MKRYVYDKKGANLSVTKIHSVHCYCCGDQMTKNKYEKQKTDHHAIPEELRPLRNIVIPICRGCHTKIHQDSQAMNPKKLKILRKVKSMKKHYGLIDEGFDKIISDLETKKDE